MSVKKYHVFIGVVVGVVLGILANRNREYLINAQFIRNHWHFRKPIENTDQLIKSDKVMIFLSFGQSNAANYGNGTYQCRNEIYNFYKGEIFPAKEPLLGPDGAGCSVWTRVADMLVDSGLYSKVIIVPIGIGQTSITKWTSGDCRTILDKALEDLKEKNIKLTHIFWDQGETDNVDGTTKQEYKSRLNKLVQIFRSNGFNAPFYSSITSYFPYNNDYPLGINPKITTAQTEVIEERKDVFPGPNTDSLNLAYYRADAVHFTEKGLDKLAEAWFKKIKESENQALSVH
ncbi:hypothetical protein LPB86_18370 [Pedobacter sp. MC2016-14]|uniref:sialate O-acetylesterase n=1 Tax=Pedobacter sp. MC2016-14 TaxID=2897327 RepID=UPI001E2AB384|nr:sialate O-acetylesterase [Pedobacter sp. MC2016-14]MCD0490212.1 hypothetical protein [Pedobacter sp. MC2016-14]